MPRATTVPNIPAARPESTRYFLLLLAILPVIILLTVVYFYVDNTPQTDAYIQTFYLLNLQSQVHTAGEFLSLLHWNYLQHNAAFFKLVFLLTYYPTGAVDFRILSILGNITLCLISWLLALNILRTRLPLYTIPVSSLMIINLYAWQVIAWPGCSLWYFGTILLAFASFHCLDLPRPKVITASICMWLAVFNMANGILCIPIAALMVIYLQYTQKKFSHRALLFFSFSTLLCLSVYIYTFNLFDTNLYGAKTAGDSFVNLGGRLVDFLESLGSTPLPINEYREGKIILGILILCLLTLLAFSKNLYKAPAITGLLLFNLGTIFCTSIFRYSAGGNDGYQVFSCIIVACVLTLGSTNFPQRSTVLPTLMLIMATAFNLNALQRNLPLIAKHDEEKTLSLKQYLWSGKMKNQEFGPILRDAISNNFYRPLQQHDSLPIAKSVTLESHCPASTAPSAGIITSQTKPESFAVLLSYRLPDFTANENHSLLLCGTQNYRIKISGQTAASNNPEHELLLEKNSIAPDTYRVALDGKLGISTFDNSITIERTGKYDSKNDDCRALGAYARFNSLKPVIKYYCP